jgi:protein kinase A
VVAVTDTVLFRVDQVTFRTILFQQTEKSKKDKTDLLRGIGFLQNLTDTDLKKLSNVMTPRVFRKDEVLVKKGEHGDAFYVLQEGRVMCKDISVGDALYENISLGPGEYFGVSQSASRTNPPFVSNEALEQLSLTLVPSFLHIQERALVTSTPRAANVVSLTQGVAFSIDRDTFEKVLGRMSSLILKAQDSRLLTGVPFIRMAKLEPPQLAALANLCCDRHFRKGEVLFHQHGTHKPALYLVREGKVRLESSDSEEVIQSGGYFGDASMLCAASNKSESVDRSPYTATVVEDCVCGVLTLQDCRNVFDTDIFSGVDVDQQNDSHLRTQEASIIKLENLKKHTILGEGTFGQVWLVSDNSEVNSAQCPFALKIQSKQHLVQEGQARAAIREKKILSDCMHPFTTKLVSSYQDDHFIYMLMEFVQGGELFSLVHQEGGGGLSEFQARFYALCIADVLAYLHHGRVAFRDLKPENVMIDTKGYPLLIDFGFAKFVPDYTYTLCGTPGYLPPEVVMQRGHNVSADHWTLGIFIYELLSGQSPFYYDGMDQMSLFESIVQDDYDPPTGASPEAIDLIAKFLEKDPTRRLGSLAQGESEIFEHPWFADLDLQALRHRVIPAPWVPSVRDPFDTSCFDDWSALEDKTTTISHRLDEKEARIFEDF